ncbi:hypothetical protein MPOCJGCO_4488 [Methylobacterium trifolii]|uniref:Uncharacterized protein n=1 Tax=Methylobacterium trifolii TaxID=1003092 RepID=A0ABQ4U887_9HYPH|nr:hypothetical protein MPOCJGCO_4488 [Methylobacterium trifolii]
MHRAHAHRPLDQHADAAQLVAETAGLALVVVLTDRGAGLEHLVHVVDREQPDHRDHPEAERHQAQGDDAPAQARGAAAHVDGADHQDGGHRRPAPGAAGEREEDARQDDQQGYERQHGPARRGGQQPVHQVEGAQRQEGAEHVRVLEGARRPVVLVEQVLDPEPLQVADDAQSGREHAAHGVGLERQLHARMGVLGEEHREEDARHAEVDELDRPGEGEVLVEIGDQRRHDRAEIEQQQADQRHHTAMQADAQAHPEQDGRDGDEVVGRGLREGEAGEEHERRQHRVGEPEHHADQGDAGVGQAEAGARPGGEGGAHGYANSTGRQRWPARRTSSLRRKG